MASGEHDPAGLRLQFPNASEASRLQLHIQRLPIIYVCLDAEMRITDWNPTAERVFGYAKKEMLGIGPPYEPLLPRSFWPEAEKIIGRLRRGDMSAHSVHENLTNYGRSITCEWFNTPLFGSDGAFAGCISYGQDVTERKTLEASFRQSQKMEAFGQLAGGVAHDFNNLLTVILGYSSILLETSSVASSDQKCLKAIFDAGTRAESLTRQLLAFSRKSVMEPRLLDLNAIVRDTGKILRRLIGENIVVHTALNPAIDQVLADPGQVGQVLMNLALNARDAMPKGGNLTIETGNVALDESYSANHPETKPGNYVMLAVSDTGGGIAPENKTRVFEPFFTTKEEGKGTGLGLSVVHGVAKQCGGSVEVYSELGIGTTFKVYLPAAKRDDVSARGAQEASALVGGYETILLVEDEAAVRRFALNALQQRGYKVMVASDGTDAMLLVDSCSDKIDLLVTDVVMPNMDGRDLADLLQSRFPEMNVLYVSGYTEDAVVRHGLLGSKAAFLQKPYTPLSLAKSVRDVLDAK